MEKEFINYIEALALKELGFDEPCFGRYCIVTEWEEPTGEILIQMFDSNLLEKNLIKAPIYQQVFRWFREEYRLTGLIEVGTQEFSYLIINDKWNRLCGTEPLKFNGTYKEAELECIKKLIEIVKLKQQTK